jgi:hypothetical protein
VLVDGIPLEAALGVQFVAQHRLVDDAGGLGLVVQRFRVDRDQRPVGARLPIRQDHVRVQMRIPAARRLVLISDGDQARQPLHVLLAGHSVVHPGVAGVGMQVRHRRVDCRGMGGGHHLLRDIMGERAQQRHALGRGEDQVEPVHTRLGKRPTMHPVGGDSVVEPPCGC